MSKKLSELEKKRKKEDLSIAEMESAIRDLELSPAEDILMIKRQRALKKKQKKEKAKQELLLIPAAKRPQPKRSARIRELASKPERVEGMGGTAIIAPTLTKEEQMKVIKKANLALKESGKPKPIEPMQKLEGLLDSSIKLLDEMQAMDDASIKTRTPLSDHFTSYGAPAPRKPKEPKIKYSSLTDEVRDSLKATLAGDDAPQDSQRNQFVWDNFLSADQQREVMGGDMSLFERVSQTFEKTEEQVWLIEGNESLTQAERQLLFHKQIVASTMEKERQKVIRPINNFEMNNSMGGGVLSGMPIDKSEKTTYLTPEIFQDFEAILDSHESDMAYNREMYKGIDVNSINAPRGITDDEIIGRYFNSLNDISNNQDVEEIEARIDDIHVLNGGPNASLFGAEDLTTTRGLGQPRNQGHFQMDVPDDLQYNPAPIDRGRAAQALEEVDEEEINRQDRVANATTIALGVGVLANAYRGIFGKDDIKTERGNDIMGDINQNIRLAGRHGMYGDDKTLGDDQMFEGLSFDKRLSSMHAFAEKRDYHSMNNIRDPTMMHQSEEQEQMEANAANRLNQSMMFNKGTGVQGSSLPQLRQQAFAYKQAGRSMAHDGFSFIRGGNSTQIQIANEFEA